MYYELYIDVLFLVNFMMDYILLLVTRRILKCSVTHGRICLGALLGAFLTCLVIALPIPYASVKFILFHCFVNVVMIKAGLKIKWDRSFFKAYVLLYVSGFLVGGVFEYLHQYMRVGSLFFALAIVCYYAALGIWNLLSRMARLHQYRCRAVLYKGTRSCEVQAVIDTGNSLRDSLTGRPVSIVDADVWGQLYDGEGMRYIPYHSIGRKEGVMPAVVLDRLYVDRMGGQWIEKPMVAAAKENIAADGAYKMILNPDIL